MALQLVVFEDGIVARELRRQRIFRERDQPFDIPEADFRDRYRLTRPKFDIVLLMIEADLQHPTGKIQSVSRFAIGSKPTVLCMRIISTSCWRYCQRAQLHCLLFNFNFIFICRKQNSQE